MTLMESTAASLRPLKAPARSLAGLPIGEIMVAQGSIGREKIGEALAAQTERGGRLGEVQKS